MMMEPNLQSAMICSIEEACQALGSVAGRSAHGALEVSHGANATVYGYPLGSGYARLASGELIQLSDIVVKAGQWRSAKAFDEEILTHRLGEAAGCAPRLFNYSFEPVHGASRASKAAVQGVMAMERLTQPTFFRWLHWVTRDQRRKAHAANVAVWTISSEALHDETVKAWERESRRLFKRLVKAGVSHGDWHERNLIFDVPEARAATAVGRKPTPLEHHDTKALIKEAIAAGPAAGRARLLVIDYGGAKPLHGRFDRFLAGIFINRHIVDADEEPPSPISRNISATDLKTVPGQKPRPIRGRLPSRFTQTLPVAPRPTPRSSRASRSSSDDTTPVSATPIEAGLG